MKTFKLFLIVCIFILITGIFVKADTFSRFNNVWIRGWLNVTNDTIKFSNINLSNNMTADYFIGNGSLLTDVPATVDTSPFWNKANNDTSNYLTQLALNISGGHLLIPTNTSWWTGLWDLVSGALWGVGNETKYTEENFTNNLAENITQGDLITPDNSTWAIKTVNDSISSYYNNSIDLSNYVSDAGIYLINNSNANFTTLLVKSPPVECPSGTFMTYTNMSTSICISAIKTSDLELVNVSMLDNKTVLRVTNITTIFGDFIPHFWELENFTGAFEAEIPVCGGSEFLTGDGSDLTCSTPTATTDTDPLDIVNQTMLDNASIARNDTIALLIGNDTINRSIDLSSYNFSVDLSSYNFSIEHITINEDQVLDLSHYTTADFLTDYENQAYYTDANATDLPFSNFQLANQTYGSESDLTTALDDNYLDINTLYSNFQIANGTALTVGGEGSGTVGNIVIDSGIHDDEYVLRGNTSIAVSNATQILFSIIEFNSSCSGFRLGTTGAPILSCT